MFASEAAAFSLSSCPNAAAHTLLSLKAFLESGAFLTGNCLLNLTSFPFCKAFAASAFAASASSILFFRASFASACFFATSSPRSLNVVGLVGGLEDLIGERGLVFRLAMRGRVAAAVVDDAFEP